MITEELENATLNVLIKKVHFDNLISSVKSFEDACNVLNISQTLPDVSTFPEEYRKSTIAQYKLTIIILALNEGWKPNLNDANEYKYWNYLYMNNGTFSYRNSLSYSSYMHVPSALFLKSRELAEYVGKTFVDLYKDYLMA